MSLRSSLDDDLWHIFGFAIGVLDSLGQLHFLFLSNTKWEFHQQPWRLTPVQNSDANYLFVGFTREMVTTQMCLFQALQERSSRHMHIVAVAQSSSQITLLIHRQ